MSTQGTSGFGTLLQRGDGQATEVFTTIAEVKSITALNLTIEVLDATSHSSTGGYREYLPSFKDAGEITAEMNFVPGDPNQSPDTGLISDFDNRTLRNFRIVFPDIAATTVQIAAYVTGFQINAPIDAILSANLTLRITGAPTWNPALLLTAETSPTEAVPKAA